MGKTDSIIDIKKNIMKKLILLIICFFIFNSIYAQWSNKFSSRWSKKHFLYASGDVMVGNYNGGDLGINYILNKKYSVKFGFSATNKPSTSQPLDFLKSSENEIPTNFNMPSENLENFHIMLGRVISFNSKEYVRIILQGGPGLSNARVPTNWQWRENNLYQSNYNYDMKINREISFILNPKIEFPLTSVIGFSIGPMLIISKEKSFFGAGIGIMYGIIGANTI